MGNSSRQKEEIKESYSLDTDQVDENWCHQFCTILTKRLQMMNSINSIVYDILLPVIIMVAGISLTSIDFF